MRLKTFSMGLVLAVLLGGMAVAAEPVKVVASFSVLGDLVSEVGGDHVVVTTLVGPNGDAHMFEASPKDAKTLGAADVLVENGLGLEHWLERLVQVSGFKGKTVIASDGVKPRLWTGDADEAEELAKDSDGRAIDPHAWQNAANGELYVQNIVEGLSAADPGHAADYRANGDKLIGELKTIDARLKQEFGALPVERRRIVTSHDAFGYFGDAYGVTFIAPEGMSTESEASAAQIASVIKQIRDENIRAIFVENITDPRLLKQIAQETGVRIGGELFSDALSPPDGPAGTYVKMFQNNEAQLLSAMSGT